MKVRLVVDSVTSKVRILFESSKRCAFRDIFLWKIKSRKSLNLNVSLLLLFLNSRAAREIQNSLKLETRGWVQLHYIISRFKKFVMGLHGILYFYRGIGIFKSIWGYNLWYQNILAICCKSSSRPKVIIYIFLLSVTEEFTYVVSGNENLDVNK